MSKYFGGPGGFASDLEAKYVVVQGFAWFLKASRNSDDEASDEVDGDEATRNTICAYVAVMNSKLFSRILHVYCPPHYGRASRSQSAVRESGSYP